MIKEPIVDAAVTDGTTTTISLPDAPQQTDLTPSQLVKEAAKPSERKPVEAEELAKVLEEHQLWLNGDEAGCQCDLSHRDLTGCGLDLSSRSFKQAILRGTNLNGLKLCKTDFSGSDLTQADIHDAVFQEADFQDAKGLLPEQFAGTDLRRAKLPDDIKAFDAIKNIEEMSKSNGKTLIGLLLGCIYTGVTLMTTTDVALLTNSGTSTLPFVSTTLPLNAFFLAAPLLLLAGYIYLHLHLQRQWEAMSKLPAYFPDGHTLDEKVYPWMLNGFVRVHLPLLHQGRANSGKGGFWRRLLSNRHGLIERAIYWSLTWAFVPFVLICTWGIYLPRRFWPWTVVHVALIALIVGAGVSYHRLAIATLRKEGNTRLWRRRGWSSGWTVIFLGLFSWLSYGAINGVPPDPKSGFLTLSYWTPQYPTRCVPWMFKFFNHAEWGAFQNLTDKDVSTKPANWTEESGTSGVKGASLQDLNLRYLNAQHSFLVKAHFEQSRLNHAWFPYAYLQGAYFNTSGPYPNPVRLDDAVFYGADLRGTHFEGTPGGDRVYFGLVPDFLVGAFLDRADFRKASLKGANFTGASLRGADLSGDSLEGVNLSYADLTGANLDRASFNGVSSLEGTIFGYQPHHSPLQLGGVDLREASLYGADFDHAELHEAKLSSVSGGRDVVALLPELFGTDLMYISLVSADLTGAELNGAVLRHANLAGARLQEAKLRFADMSEVKFLDRERDAKGNYIKDRKGNYYVIRTDLRGVDLSEVKGLTREQLTQEGVEMDSTTKKPIYYWHWVGHGKESHLNPENPDAEKNLHARWYGVIEQEQKQAVQQGRTKK